MVTLGNVFGFWGKVSDALEVLSVLDITVPDVVEVAWCEGDEAVNGVVELSHPRLDFGNIFGKAIKDAGVVDVVNGGVGEDMVGAADEGTVIEGALLEYGAFCAPGEADVSVGIVVTIVGVCGVAGAETSPESVVSDGVDIFLSFVEVEVGRQLIFFEVDAPLEGLDEVSVLEFFDALGEPVEVSEQGIGIDPEDVVEVIWQGFDDVVNEGFLVPQQGVGFDGGDAGVVRQLAFCAVDEAFEDTEVEVSDGAEPLLEGDESVGVILRVIEAGDDDGTGVGPVAVAVHEGVFEPVEHLISFLLAVEIG